MRMATTATMLHNFPPKSWPLFAQFGVSKCENTKKVRSLMCVLYPCCHHQLVFPPSCPLRLDLLYVSLPAVDSIQLVRLEPRLKRSSVAHPNRHRQILTYSMRPSAVVFLSKRLNNSHGPTNDDKMPNYSGRKNSSPKK